MTKLLLRLFVPNWERTQDPHVRALCGRLGGIVGIVCNLLLFLGKLLAGTLSGSVSITADAFNNLSDASGSLVTLLGFRLAEKPADKDHPYGHARMEYISSLVVAALILLIGVELVKSSVGQILHPEPVTVSPLLVGVLLVSILVKLWLSLFHGKLGRMMDSQTLRAASADSRGDMLSTAAVLVSAVVQKFTSWNVDGYVGLAVALFILWSGIGIAKSTVDLLLGMGPSPELRRALSQELERAPKVLGFHDLMVHDYGPGRRFATVHVEMDAREDPMVCHDIIDDLERLCLQRHQVQLCIHYDPVITDDPILNEARLLVQEHAREIDDRLLVHDFRMVQGPTHTNLIFDVVAPFGLKLSQEDLTRRLSAAIREHYPDYYIVITVDWDDIAPESGKE